MSGGSGASSYLDVLLLGRGYLAGMVGSWFQGISCIWSSLLTSSVGSFAYLGVASLRIGYIPAWRVSGYLPRSDVVRVLGRGSWKVVVGRRVSWSHLQLVCSVIPSRSVNTATYGYMRVLRHRVKIVLKKFIRSQKRHCSFHPVFVGLCEHIRHFSTNR